LIINRAKNIKDLTPQNVKYAISTDWFSAILSTAEPVVNFGEPLEMYEYDFGNIILQKMKYCAPQFKFGYDIIVKKKPFARVHVCPTSEMIFKSNQMQFELLNNIHYEIGWCDDLDYLFKKLGWKIDNISRLDIALDGSNAGFLKVMNMALEKKIEKVGRSKLQFFTNSKIDLEGCDIGKRSSDKWVTCYNKTKELEKSNKFYIRKFWERAGLDTAHVERLELKLRCESIKMIVGFDWRKLDNFEYLASIFRTFIEGGDLINVDTGEIKFSKGMIEFVIKSKRKNISRKKRIEFINWDYIGGEKLERLSTKQANEVWSMKLTAKRITWIYFQTNQDHFLHIVREICFNIDQLDWFEEKFNGWKEDFEIKKQDGKLEYISNYTQGYANQQLMLYEIPKNLL